MAGRAAFNLALAAILGLFVAACLFVHPMADDFIYASNARVGLWSAWLQEYIGWNGRYASNVLLLSTPLAFGWLAAYRATAAVMLASTVVATYLFVRTLAAGGVTRQDAIGCSLTFTLLYFSQMPSLGESGYWYTAAAVYHVPLVIVLLHLMLVIRYTRLDRPTIGGRLSLTLAIGLLIAAVGFNEVVMLIMLALYGALFTLSLRAHESARIVFGGLFVLTFVCALAVLFSPGNAVRQSMYSAHHQFGRSFFMTALQTLRFTSVWVTSGALLLATFVFVPIAERLSSRRLPHPHQARRYLPLAVAGLLLVVPIGVFPAYWETGVLGQHRTVNTAFFAFLILWFIGTAMWLSSGTRRAQALKLFGHQLSLPLALLLLAALALTGNSYVLGSDLISGRLAAFDREMNGRYGELQACRARNQRACDIDGIHTKPASFYIVDVSADPANWVNVSYARYFGLSEVRLRNGNGQ